MDTKLARKSLTTRLEEEMRAEGWTWKWTQDNGRLVCFFERGAGMEGPFTPGELADTMDVPLSDPNY